MKLKSYVRSLRTKLFFALFGISSAIAIAFSVVLFLHMKSTHINNLQSQGTTTANLIAQNLSRTNLRDEKVQRETVESLVRMNSQILRVEVRQPLYNMNRVLFVQSVSDSFVTWLNLYDPFIEITVPLHNEFNGKPQGLVIVQMQTESITKDVIQYAEHLIGALIGIIFVLGIVCNYVSGAFTHRLTRIDHALKELKEGRYQLTACHGQDEVHQIEKQILELSSTLRGEREAMMLSAVEALVTALEAKDSYTFGHSKEVANFAWEIAVAAGLNEREVFNIRLAALLHDIGKIGIPDHILNKPSRLTQEEWEQVKAHPSIGAKIISGIPALKDIASLVLYHHSRWDGQGYPGSLAGDTIPLGARIIAIADSLQAIISDRPYRKGMPFSFAVEEIRLGAGTQFDPRAVVWAETVFLRKMQ